MTKAGLFTAAGRAVPLRGVEVLAHVTAGHIEAAVHQRYRNDEAAAVEAIYTFPLPSGAVLTSFSMACDGRRVEGVVREREQAFREYDESIARGHGAALLEQERANVFTASVGNLLPGEEVLIEIGYAERLAADEGALRVSVPTLVAPRYVPGGPQAGDRTGHGALEPTAAVPDADRISPPQGRAAYGLSVDMLFDLGREVTVESPSHRIACEPVGGHRVRATFAAGEVALDRDVVLTARGAPGPSAGLVCHRGPEGAEGYFALTVVPDLFEHAKGGRAPREVVFLVDTSGSMGGASLPQAKAALRLCLRHLGEGDRFSILAFSTSHRAFAPRPVPFTQATLSRADAWVEGLRADGGTELLAPLVEGLKLAPDGVLVLLTDGQVGNEAQILKAALAARSGARVYSFGIGTNVSDTLLRDLATKTGGAVEFIHPGERIDEKVVAQFARATAGRVTGVEVRFVGLDAGELAPSKVRDVIDGEPWVLFGRYEDAGEGRVELRGSLDGRPFYLEVPASFEARAERPLLPKLWAKERIADLEAAALDGRRAGAMRERIVKLAVEHGVATAHTSFVVVEKRKGERRANEQPEARVVPVSLPSGWAMFDGRRDGKGWRRVDMSTLAGLPDWGSCDVAPPPPSGMAGGRARGGVSKSRSASPPQAPVARSPMPAGRPGAAPPMMSRPGAPAPRGPNKAGEPADVSNRPLSSSFDSLEIENHSDFVEFERAPAPTAPASTAERASRAKKSEAGEVERVVEILARQLASGLWGEPGAAAALRLRATALALLSLVRAGVTTAHPVYGAQVRKAVEALLELAEGLADADLAGAELPLAVAWLATTGPRTRDRIGRLAGSRAALSTLRAKLGDEAALRAHVDGAAPA